MSRRSLVIALTSALVLVGVLSVTLAVQAATSIFGHTRVVRDPAGDMSMLRVLNLDAGLQKLAANAGPRAPMRSLEITPGAIVALVHPATSGWRRMSVDADGRIRVQRPDAVAAHAPAITVGGIRAGRVGVLVDALARVRRGTTLRSLRAVEAGPDGWRLRLVDGSTWRAVPRSHVLRCASGC